MEPAAGRQVGILLAAGRGARFDPSGGRSKLMQPLQGGELLAVAAARNLLAAVSEVLAVVRPDADALATRLRSLGCAVTACPDAEQGMGASLAHAVSVAAEADGWVIALADMPRVQPATIAALLAAIRAGADIAIPTHNGRRGNPVAFDRTHLLRLLQSQGDQGARSLLKAFPVTEVVVPDDGIFFDIDTPEDLARAF